MDFMEVPRCLIMICMVVCVRSRTVPTTLPPTPLMTAPPGCVYNGQHYPPGANIEKGYDPSSNWCYETICSNDGQILHGDNFNCYPTTTPPTTLPPTTTTTTSPGCTIAGQHYRPGEMIYESPGHGSWCSGAICGSDGQVQLWDNFNCHSTTTTTTTPMPTTPAGCFYNGKWYRYGDSIQTGYDAASNWCYGAICLQTGGMVPWDNFHCKTTTPNPTSYHQVVG